MGCNSSKKRSIPNQPSIPPQPSTSPQPSSPLQPFIPSRPTTKRMLTGLNGIDFQMEHQDSTQIRQIQATIQAVIKE